MAFSVRGDYRVAKVSPTAIKSKQGRDRKGKATIPDEIVLAIRRMHEIDRKTSIQVMEAYPQYTNTYIRAILGYMLRAHLKP